MKNEPEWMLDIRLKAYHEFAKMKWPTFGPDLSSVTFDDYIYYIKSSKKLKAVGMKFLPQSKILLIN